MERQYDRGEFLAACGLVGLGVASLANAGCSLGAMTGSSPSDETSGEESGREDIGREPTVAEDVMSSGVMVGYATRTGSTKGVAEAIAEELRGRGMDVSLVDMAARTSPRGFESAVLCSAVQGGAWIPEAQSFVETHSALLSDIPVALVCVHIMNAGDDGRSRERRAAYLDKVRPNVNVSDETFFLGRGPTAEEAGWVMRWAFKAFGGAGEGDLRDWDAIRGWARDIQLQKG